MKRYAVSGVSGAGASPLTIVTVIGSATIRPAIYDLLVGCGGTPADQGAVIRCQRTTTAGTVSSVTPEPLDGDDLPAVSTAGQTATAEPTYAGVPYLQFGLHQRASFRWVAAPGGELRVTGATNNGMGVKRHTGPSIAYDATIHFME